MFKPPFSRDKNVRTRLDFAAAAPSRRLRQVAPRGRRRADPLGVAAGPRVFSFCWRTRRPPASVVHRWKNPTQTFPTRRRSIRLTQPSGASVRGNWRPRLQTKSTGEPSGLGLLADGWPECRTMVVSSAMAAVYVPSIHRANSGWKGKWKGCFSV